jgi:enoyl-CoA hydratase
VTYKNVLYEKADDARIVTITVNRPEKLNALNEGVWFDLAAAFARAKVDPDCGVVIVTGAGEKAFVAGADIRELTELDVPGSKAKSKRGQDVLQRIESLGKPVIAMINGFALGGGLEVALACHLRTMAAETKIGVPEVGLGLLPGYGATQRLPRLVGRGRALEMLLTGDPMDAETALAYGIVNRVAPAGELRAVTEKLAKKLLTRGPLALGGALEAVLRGSDLPLAEGLGIESDVFGITAGTHDSREGLNAFVEKRKPSFEGR